jgi:hypothetical protein
MDTSRTRPVTRGAAGRTLHRSADGTRGDVRKGRIDYRMQRRSALRDLAVGRRSRDEVCDAHPELLRAGVHLGEDAPEPCPVCDEDDLRHVVYVFEGKNRRTPGGRAVARSSLARQAQRHGDLTVYTVEVCVRCRWHHLVESYLLLARDDAVGEA